MFKVGDRVECIDDVGFNGLEKGEVYRVEYVSLAGDLQLQGVPFCDGFVSSRFRPAPTLHVFKSEGTIEVGGPIRSARDNAGKPESDYILTYPGGVQAAFAGKFLFYRTLVMLSQWYRGKASTLDVVLTLHLDASANDLDIVSALTETNTRAEKSGKYKQGNYLLGSNWRQYCQSAVRHAQALQKGETYDAEGNNHLGALVFNILALDMCVTQNLGVDDRIRPPST